MTMTSVGVMQEFTRAENARRAPSASSAMPRSHARRASRQHRRDPARHGAGVARSILRGSDADGDIRAEAAGSQAEIEAAESAVSRGRGNLADILAARSALVLSTIAPARSGAKLSAAKIALARWIGNDADAPLAGKPAIDADPPRSDHA